MSRVDGSIYKLMESLLKLQLPDTGRLWTNASGEAAANGSDGNHRGPARSQILLLLPVNFPWQAGMM